MPPIPLIMICTCDLAGQVRGKALPLSRLEDRAQLGIGWTPTNSQITAHGPIAPTPWGALGDTYLKPDLSTKIDLEIGPERFERFVMADIMTLAHEPWSCCPRGFLKRQIEALAEHGLTLRAAFEHEFAYLGEPERPNSSYSLASFRQQGGFADKLFGVIDQAGVKIDTFMPEYGPSQYEITIGASDALRAADEAVILRELVRATALTEGRRASFTPILRPDAVGNGVHIHFSLADQAGQPVNYAPAQSMNVAPKAAAFLEGVRRHLPGLLAVTAAGTVSYLRLQPNRWSAVHNNISAQDREAALRICPVFGDNPDQAFHFEYRAADATSSPYLALGAIMAAGLAGLTEGLAIEADAHVERLPKTLDEALEWLRADQVLERALGPTLHSLYLDHKVHEAEFMGHLSPQEQCRRYALAY